MNAISLNTHFYQIAWLFRFIGIKNLIKITGQKLIFPFYHLVSDDDVVHVKHLYPVRTVKQFEQDLEFFLREYQKVHVSDLIQAKRGSGPGKNGFLLSFDDGLREFYDIITPILIRRGIPAICFLNSGFIDNRDMFFRYKASILVENLKRRKISESVEKELTRYARQHHLHYDRNGKFLLAIRYSDRLVLDQLAVILDVDFREYLERYQPYLTGSQVETLQKQGFIFGAHSIDHPCYAELSTQQKVYQTTQSISEITERFKLTYKLFSFPFTDDGITNSFFSTLFNADHPMADISFGCAGLKNDSIKRHLQRIPIEIGSFSAEDIIYGEYLYYLLKALVNRNTIYRH